MVDPFGITALFVTSLQFALQFKTYIEERKRRKRQEQEQQLPQQQQQQQQHIMQYSQANSTPFSTPIIIYCICSHIPPPTYPHAHYIPSYYPLPLVPPPANFNYHRSIDASSLPSSSTHMLASTPPYDWLGLLGGRAEPIHPHMNTHHVHESHGMRTGSWPNFGSNSSYFHHWKSLKEGMRSQTWNEGSIAVVDRSKGNIDMFMEKGGIYFRNYRIRNCDALMFAYLFQRREVFSGEIKEGKLERCSKEMKMVEIMRSSRGGQLSTNSWMRLGIHDDIEGMQDVLNERISFVQTVRAAVLGLVCCLYEAPHNINVDMDIFGDHEIVRINTDSNILKRNTNCCFSVFSFGDQGWAAHDILVG